MKQNTTLKSLLLSAAAALALAASARADTPLETPALTSTTPVQQGLLGQQYSSLTYSYLNLDNSPRNADNFEFALNQPLNTGLDAVVAYNWTQLGQLASGDRPNTQSVTASLRAFCNAYSWGKPYVEAGLGYAWQHDAPGSDGSYVWRAAVGTEFQVAPAVTVTPYVEYADAPDLPGRGAWNFGAKANYWVTSQWALTAGLAENNHHDMKYTLGTNFRF